MESASLCHLPENLSVLRKMFNRVDFYSTCIQRIRTFLNDHSKCFDLTKPEHARTVYTSSVEDFVSLQYDCFIDDMKAELTIDSIAKLIECSESTLADKWLVTGHYNLMKNDLSHISWELDRAMEVDGLESRAKKLQEDVPIQNSSDENHVPYWSSVIIITTTHFYAGDPWNRLKPFEADGYKAETLYHNFSLVANFFDKTGKLFDLYRIKKPARPVQLYFRVPDATGVDAVKKALPSIRLKAKDDLAIIADKLYRLKKIWIHNERKKSVNKTPENGERLKTIKLLQSLLPCIDDNGFPKKKGVYQNELKEIEHFVNEYVKSCSPCEQLSLLIVGFGDFTLFEEPNRLRTAISYIEEIPDARQGLQDYLATWERQNNIDLTAMILLYKKQVKQLRDKAAAEILENVGATKEEVKKDPAALEALRKACLDRMPGKAAFYELVYRCFNSDPPCISDEIVYKDV